MRNDDALVKLSQGSLQGKLDGTISIFHNIPYAQAERFQLPQAPPSWEGVRMATAPVARCYQNPSTFKTVIGELKNPPAMTEDCHLISIHSPDLKGKKAVMVWIHGGGYSSSGGEEAWYNPLKMTTEGDVVNVSISYRLGIFGFLWWPEKGIKNLGLEDQMAALKWIKNNIAQFGGDPDNITVFGQSAGAYSIATLLATVKEPLFNRAIMQSAPLSQGLSTRGATKLRERFLTLIGKDPFTASTSEILAAQRTMLTETSKGMLFSPIDVSLKGSTLMPMKNMDLLIGWTKDDASPFVYMRINKTGRKFGNYLDRIIVRLFTHLAFSKPSVAYAAFWKKKGMAVTLYQLNWRPTNSVYGACHAVDLPLLFGNATVWRDSPLIGSTSMDELDSKGIQMRAAWVQFAKTGKASSSLTDLEFNKTS